MNMEIDQPLTKVELTISCQKLKNLDALSKSDPLVVLYIMDTQSRWTEYARTETIKDNLNPKFVKTIQIDYRFEEVQPLRFVVVDVDNPQLSVDRQDFIGTLECKLADILTSRGQSITRELKDPNHPTSKRGTITIQAEELKELNNIVKFQFSGVHLDKKDLFGKSDPYLVISKVKEGNQFVQVTKTETIMKTLDPQWKQFEVPVQKLCNGDFDRPLLFECYDWNRNSSHELIGNFKTSLRELLSGEKREFELIDPKKHKKGYKNSGIIKLMQCEVIKTFSFLDYLAGGCEISLIVAIDFTASNGNPQFSNSLHFNNPNIYQPNDYVRAITSVGSILADYDSDKNFPVYGFGAKLPPTGQVSHCFPLNGSYTNPEVQGVQGIVSVYQQALTSVTLYGPTIFQQILQVTSQIASTFISQESQKYFVLLIITDGVINDMDNTIDEIVNASELPLSIVIVGVGDADFKNMEILDADDSILKSRSGKAAKRDIVQFVPMNKFKNLHPSALAKEVLAEIPSQLLASMRDRNIKPNPPRTYDPNFVQTPQYQSTNGGFSIPPPSSLQPQSEFTVPPPYVPTAPPSAPPDNNP